MGKSNQTVNDAQLKARRTSLGKKSNEELINIILRKDKTERSLNRKIQELQKHLEESNSSKSIIIARINKLQEELVTLRSNIKIHKDNIDIINEEYKALHDKCVRIKHISELRRKTMITSFVIIIILLIKLILF